MAEVKLPTSCREAIDFLKAEGDLKVIKPEVDPILEVGAINKAFDEGPAFVCDSVKGYPNSRYIVNMYGRRDRVAKLLGCKEFKDLKFKILDAIKQPTPPRVVTKAPCQEVFLPKEEVDPWKLFPMIKHTEMDGGRFFGSGVHYISGKWANNASQLALYRMGWRGKDFASINMVPGGHGDQIADTFPTSKIPCTVNICPSPAVDVMAIGSFIPTVFPFGMDEIAIAGTLQNAPVEIVKAKTVDAYAIANAEMVIEGYIVPNERVWETEEAEKMNEQGVAHFHPEWARYLGRAYRSRRFEVTAVTMRKDKPYYFVPYFGTNYASTPTLEASYFELFRRMAPGFCVDVHNPIGLTVWSGIAFQVKKRRRSDEGMQRNLLAATLGAVRGIRLAIALDEDINMYIPEDIFFALTTRVNPATDIVRGVGGRGHSYQPSERMAAGAGAGHTRPVSVFEGGIGIDATVPLLEREQFYRPHYAVDKVDFHKWFTDEEIKSMKARQGEYIRWLGETGHP